MLLEAPSTNKAVPDEHWIHVAHGQGYAERPAWLDEPGALDSSKWISVLTGKSMAES